jgi:DNA-binding NarL/FixJ family response regulator
LVEAIKKILGGARYITSTVGEQLAGQLGLNTDRPVHELLSDREYEIMQMIASGLSLKQIAIDLSLSPQTVSTHRARFMKKMGLRTTTEIIRYALEHSLLD